MSNSIPHDIQAERGALGCVWLADQDQAADYLSQLHPELFYDLRHRELLAAFNGLPADQFDVGKYRITRESDAIRATIADVEGASPSADPEMFASFRATLIEEAEFRQTIDGAETLITVCRDRRIAADKLSEVRMDFAFADWSTKSANSFTDLWNLRLDMKAPPPAPRVVYRIGQTPIATPGNITTISAQAKSGKSSFIGAMISAAMTPIDSSADNLGLVAAPASYGAIVHIDTEQVSSDHYRLITTSVRRAGVDTVHPNIFSFGTKGKTYDEQRRALDYYIRRIGRLTGGVFHSIILDGVADYVSSINDEAECNLFVAQLEAIAVENDCPLIAVIHQNPGTEKTRGHLGSALERKSESNLPLKKEGEITSVISTMQRGAPITTDNGPRFRWDKESGMHRSCEPASVAKEKERVERSILEVETVFGEDLELGYGEMQERAMKQLGFKSRTTFESHLNMWKKCQKITNCGKGRWKQL